MKCFVYYSNRTSQILVLCLCDDEVQQSLCGVGVKGKGRCFIISSTEGEADATKSHAADAMVVSSSLTSNTPALGSKVATNHTAPSF